MMKAGSEVTDFLKLARSHDLRPKIINEDSNFVIVTYWWGRGNLNKNTQRPCPDEIAVGQKLDKQPFKFEEMINNWEKSCKKHKCNFLAEEYPEFAIKGGYQHAINFKPNFINLALKACSPRGVLYIDGDMHIKLYPEVCDTEDIDFMGRGWNTDPRPGNWRKSNKFCFDPYIVEPSGGTLFFGNTLYGKKLASLWAEESLKYPGKADDRILSLAIIRNRMLVPMTSITLPIEYLWLDLWYDEYFDDGEEYNKKQIVISHPECLTSEDMAQAHGASSNRYPRGYDRYVSDFIMCDWEEIYEYIQFDNKKQLKPFKASFDFLEQHDVADIIPFDSKYGKDGNIIAKQNEKMMKSINTHVTENAVIVSPHPFGTSALHQIEDSELIIPTILAYLENGQNVVYIPGKPTSARWVIEKAAREKLDFVTRNTNTTLKRSKPEFYLKLDPEYPIFFGANSNTLKHLLRMSDSISGVEKMFDRSYLFLTRIRCGWI